MRSSAPEPWKRRANRAPLPNSANRPMIRSCAISSSGWFITGVPVNASRERVAAAAPRPAAAPPASGVRAGS